MTYVDYVGETTENRLHTGSDISMDIFSNFSL